jgi:hypothetical protein
LRVSDANCRPGEHAISGGYVMREVNFATVTEQWSLPTPFVEDGIPTGWQVAINDGGHNKRITAYVICVPD